MTDITLSAVAGVAVAGFTNPLYTYTEDASPNPNGRRFLCLTLGGTQPNVEVHSISSPFVFDFSRPSQLKSQVPVNSNGTLSSIGVNRYSIRMLKGMTINGGNGITYEKVSPWALNIPIPAGAELSDPEEISAQYSAFVGMLVANANFFINMLKTGAIKQ